VEDDVTLQPEGSRIGILPVAPSASDFTAYDTAQMLIYARLLDAEHQGHNWQDAAREILLLDIEADPEAAHVCWQSHYERAQWAIRDGMLKAAEAGADLSASSAQGG
jgi:hypothetical protein